VLLLLNGLTSIWNLLSLLGGGLDILVVAALLPGIAIVGYIVYWFAKNDQYFA
jgi:hypothetical protein